MELWIRSQDKKILSKIETVNINYNNENEIIANYKQLNRDDEDYTILGTYKTKERALEILDEIQNIFSLKIENKSYEESDLFLKAKMLDSVYEMPEE